MSKALQSKLFHIDTQQSHNLNVYRESWRSGSKRRKLSLYGDKFWPYCERRRSRTYMQKQPSTCASGRTRNPFARLCLDIRKQRTPLSADLVEKGGPVLGQVRHKRIKQVPCSERRRSVSRHIAIHRQGEVHLRHRPRTLGCRRLPALEIRVKHRAKTRRRT